ncbi:hypothetical protein [Priestia endophytica]|uniref:hypothetical protein n=1 Tax=Priestia endophytica TaxID=135735 RepID=UPI000DCA6C5D|nr:hypothetical protein [Priestia endophytica]RAS82339.1 hypothetical protein A4R27_09100 [Priestia endophytica]
MRDKKVIKQNGDNPLAFIDSNVSVTIKADGQYSEETKQFHKEVKSDLKETKQKISGLVNYLASIINKGFEKVRGNIGYDVALNMNTLQRGGNYAPPLSSTLLKRTSTLSMHDSYLNDLTWLHIYGDVLTGKTHYLYLLAEKLKASNTIWFKCKNLNTEQVNMTIKLTLAESTKTNLTNEREWFDKVISRLEKETVLIIDDIPSVQHNEILFDNLSLLYSSCEKYGVKIISSGSVRLRQSLTKLFKRDGFKSIQIQPFINEDIIELIQLKNKELKNVPNYASWIGAVTKYNPSLVIACVDYIDSKKWQFTSEVVNNVNNGFYSLELSSEVRDLLLEDIKDENAKELLYRLSIINNEFDNRYIDEISSVSPEITYPYDKVHLLEGYWLQRTRQGYRTSPFIDKIGEKNLPSGTVKRVHLCIAEVIEKSKVLSPSEFVKLFTHLVLAEKLDNAAYVLSSALNELNNSEIDKDYWLITSLWSKTSLSKDISIELRVYLRVKQIIAHLKFQKDVKYLLKDLDILMGELSANNEKKVFVNIAYLMLSIESLDYDINLSLIWLGQAFASKTAKDSLIDEKLIEKVYNENEKIEIFRGSIEPLIWLYPAKIQGDINQVEKFLNIIDNMSKEQVKRAFEDDLSYEGSMFLVESIWLEEARLDISKRDWDRCISALHKVKECAENNGNPILYACAIRGLIIVMFEFLNKKEEAVVLYNSSLSFNHNNDSLFLLHSIMGKQYAYIKENEKAMTYFSLAIEQKSQNYLFELVDTLVFAAKCVSGKNNSETATYLENAIQINNGIEVNSEILKAKLLGELGIHYFIEGAYTDSYNYFENSLRALQEAEENSNIRESTIVALSHTLGYITTVIKTGIAPQDLGEETYTKPYIGMIWAENDKRHKFYSRDKEVQLNTLMAYMAGGVDKREDEFYWLKRCEIESQKYDIEGPLVFINKKELIPHLILKHDFQNAINKGIEFCIELVASMDSSRISGKPLQIGDIEATINNPDRFSYSINMSIPYVFVPIMCHLAELRIKGKESIREIIKDIIQAIEDNKIKYKDCEVFNKIIKVFTLVFLNRGNAKDFLVGVNAYSDNEKTLYYMAYSLETSKANAMDTHLKIIYYLHRIYEREKFILLNIITPFFQAFWVDSYIKNRYDFNNTEIIDRKLEELLVQRDEKTIKRILNLMNCGLGISVPKEVREFLTV